VHKEGSTLAEGKRQKLTRPYRLPRKHKLNLNSVFKTRHCGHCDEISCHRITAELAAAG
jgi:hypothetical protein